MVNVIGNEITEALERLGKTQAWLAEEVGVSNTAVTKWIQNGDISREAAVKVAQALGISLDKLLTGKPDTPGKQMAEVIDALPQEAQQQVLDFVGYKIDRAEEFIASEPEKFSHYRRMVEKIKADFSRLPPNDKPGGKPPKKR